MSKTVLIVDDSILMRRLVHDIIKKDKELEVIGTANNGAKAIELNKSLKPDVILLDVEMPVMNGLEALKIIMTERPCAVVMFSSHTGEGANTTLQALEIGAVEFIAKPFGTGFKLEPMVVDEILNKLKSAKYIPKQLSKVYPKRKNILPLKHSRKFKKIVAIGISTGGPRALQEVLVDIPSDFPSPILVVQHMPKLFTKAFAERLDNVCSVKVKEAEDKDVLESGTVYIAPGDYHLRVKEDAQVITISICDDEKVSGHRPSADVMFNSLCNIKNAEVVGVIMTGMGRDGAEGLLKLKKRGATTIAQDEESSVVYGMPKSAVELGAVDFISPLSQIAEKIVSFMGV